MKFWCLTPGRDQLYAVYPYFNNLHIFVNAEKAETALTGKERQRLFGAGVKNYGFIEKAFEIMRDNPDNAPPHLNVGEMLIKNESPHASGGLHEVIEKVQIQ